MPRVLGHLDRHPQRGPARSLAHPGLQHPELALLDRELGVAHVAVVPLQAIEDVQELGVDLGEGVVQRGQGLGVADPGHHVLALGVDEEVAVVAGRPGGRVPGEAHAGAGPIVAVAEHHGLDVDGGTQVVGDALALPVGDGPGTVPDCETPPRSPRAAARRGPAGRAGRCAVARSAGTSGPGTAGAPSGTSASDVVPASSLAASKRSSNSCPGMSRTMRPYMAMKRR